MFYLFIYLFFLLPFRIDNLKNPAKGGYGEDQGRKTLVLPWL